MTPAPGKLLTADESRRFELSSADVKQLLIQAIVSQLRRTVRVAQYVQDGDAPAHVWRRMEV